MTASSTSSTRTWTSRRSRAPRCAETPTITTLHGRLDLPDLPRLYARFPEAGVDLDLGQPARAAAGARWLGTVYNAVDIDRLPFNPRGGDYLAFLGRISPEKGLDRAIRIAQLAGLPLKVGGAAATQGHQQPGRSG